VAPLRGLVNAVIESAREQQASKVIVAVLEGNARALALYRRPGFIDVGANPCTSSEAERKMALSPLQAVR
jgi:ribosomal protein S18 acetylase RimI-like enzyme